MKNRYAVKMDKLKWYGVDLDNTLAEPIWPKPGIGKIKKGAKEAIAKIIKSGKKIVIHTARPWGDYENIERWCKDNKIPVKAIVCGKLLVEWYIDDRGVEFSGDWGKVINKVKK